MRYGKKLLFLPLLTLSICLSAYFLVSKTNAQEASTYDVTVSPVFYELTANPGNTISERIRVRNNTNSPIPVRLEVKRLAGDENGDLTFNEENSDNSLDWISFTDNTVTLAPQEFTIIPFQIEVPETAAYGYYYGISLTQSDSSTDSTGAAISGAAAIPVLLTVRSSDAKSEIKLKEFNVNSFINETLPVDFEVKLENGGNVHVRPRGNIFISGMGKENITSIDINPNGAAIIPNTVRTFLASWTDGFIVREPILEDGKPKVDDNGKAETQIKINWNKATDFRFGKYTANLLVVYDDGTRDVPIEASKSFWIIPYKALAVAIIAVVLVALTFRFFIKRYINREVKKRSR
jgi:hypothetical protein